MKDHTRTPFATPLLNSLAPDQMHHVLFHLVRTDPAIAARAEEIAGTLIGDVDPEDIAETLADDLSSLEIEDVWHTAGRTRDGDHIDTSERAWQMMDEVVSPHRDEMMAYIRRGMPEESRRYCSGILLGLRNFEETDSPFCKEIPDYGSETSIDIRQEWEEAICDTEQIALLVDFLEEQGLR